MVQVKIKTIKNKVDALTKIDLNNLNFEGLADDGKSSKIHKEILDISRELSRFARELKNAEKQYADNFVSSQLADVFGKLVDLYDGDISKAITAINLVVDNMVNRINPSAEEIKAEADRLEQRNKTDPTDKTESVKAQDTTTVSERKKVLGADNSAKEVPKTIKTNETVDEINHKISKKHLKNN